MRRREGVQDARVQVRGEPVTRMVFSASARVNSMFSSAENLRLSRTMMSPGFDSSMAAFAA